MPKDYDPRMHSAEHILNQTMVRMFGCGRSFSMHLEKKKSKCDYHFDRNLTDDEVHEIERRVNEVIQSDAVVREEFLTRADAATLFDLGKLPEHAGDTVRIIRIGDYDACPCIGQHVRTTKEIGTFHILSTSYENGVLRIRFKLSEQIPPP
jgi:Ser-tRNA(Ala) deacylase AlaX